MYIEPNSTIQLFTNLRLDKGYSNTMWFTNVSAQNTFFGGLNPITLTNNSYQRKDIGVFRCILGIEQLQGINYMRFRNTSFENKWFYAFVNRVEYVNNAMCNVYYTIDVIQTYMFDWTLHECMIERQHSTTDVAGDNTQPEGLELGYAIDDGEIETLYNPNNEQYCAIVSLSIAPEYYAEIIDSDVMQPDEYRQIGWIGGLPYITQNLKYVLSAQGAGLSRFALLMNYLSEINQVDSVASIILAPQNLSLTNHTPYSINYYKTKASSVNGYTPTNKKCLTYPYCYCEIMNAEGQSVELKYELFKLDFQGRIKFVMKLIGGAIPECILFPHYDGNEKTFRYNLAMGDFPQIGFASDGYKSWIAMNYEQTELNKDYYQLSDIYNQHGLSISKRQNLLDYQSKQLSNIGSAFSKGALGAETGLQSSFVGATQSAFQVPITTRQYNAENDQLDLEGKASESEKYYKIASANISESVAEKLPNSMRSGKASSFTGLAYSGFYFQRKAIKYEYITRVDKYFTMFGYAQNKVDTPNIHARQYFTYIKTSGSSVSGIIPEDDKEVINTVFDRGIRFWTDYTKFENYAVNNAII